MRKVIVFFALLFLLCGFIPAQNDDEDAQRGRHARNDPQFGQHRNERNESLQKLEKERVKRLNKERHDRIKTDTDKLLALATELKEYVDKSNENVLSLDVIRKAEEIEKLAHQVREKMKSEQ